MNTKAGQGTRAVWAGEEGHLLGASQVSVVLSAAFGFKDLNHWLEVSLGKAEGHFYTRNSNPTNPTTEVLDFARQQLRGFGGILSFQLKGNGHEAVGRNIPNLRFDHAAGNLGAVGTIMAQPATSSHVERTQEERARQEIPEGLIRYTTGIEDVEDLIYDLPTALERL